VGASLLAKAAADSPQYLLLYWRPRLAAL